MHNIGKMAVFTDGVVICPAGVDGVWLVNRVLLLHFGALGSLLLAAVRPGQRRIRARGQRAVRNVPWGWDDRPGRLDSPRGRGR